MISTASSTFCAVFSQLTTAGFDAGSEQELYTAVSQYLPELLPVEFCNVAIVRAEDAIEIVDLQQLEGVPQNSAIDNTLLQNCLEIRQPMLVTVSQDSIYTDVVHLSKNGFVQMACVPLLASDQLIGAINIATTQENLDQESQLCILTQVAALVTTNLVRLNSEAQIQYTLDRHRRYAERLEVLSDIGQKISATQTEEGVFHTVAEAIERILEADRVSYVVPNPDQISCQIFALTGNDIIPKAHKYPLQGSGIAVVLNKAEPMAFPDLTDSTYQEHVMLASQGLRMGWSVPIFVNREVVGILNAATVVQWPFPEDALTLLSALGRFMGTTIERIQAQRAVDTALQNLEYQVAHDQLTKLLNRRCFEKLLNQSLIQHQDQQLCLAVLFLDLDGFKEVNDSLSHSVGDQLLCAVANRLRAQVDADGVVARLGGDEFVVLLRDIAGLEPVFNLSQHLLKALNEPFDILDQQIQIGGSLGISLFPEHGQTTDALMKHADIAMYAAKARGRNTFELYARHMSDRLEARLEIERELRTAIKHDELFMMYQPQMDIASGQICSVEALIRWIHPVRGVVSPGVFIPIAEQSGLIGDITSWVLEESLTTLAMLRADYPDLYMSINVSAADLLAPERLDSQIQDLLQQLSLPGHALELELTEGVFLEHAVTASELLHEWKHQGIRLAIDDFGTGFSSLNYLLNLPFDTLKIDRRFVRSLHQNNRIRGIAKTILALSANLDAECVAEGVEDLAELDCLCELGCDKVQGFVLARPMVTHQLIEFLEHHYVNPISTARSSSV